MGVDGVVCPNAELEGGGVISGHLAQQLQHGEKGGFAKSGMERDLFIFSCLPLASSGQRPGSSVESTLLLTSRLAA